MNLKLIAAAFTLLTGVLGAAFWNSDRPYQVTAYVLTADGVVPQNAVTMGGVTVGSVSSVGIVPDDQTSQGGATITLQIDSRYTPLPLGTRATIRPQGLLGSKFVELTPGGLGGQTIPSGGSIPLHDTATPVDLSQVQDIFNQYVSAKLKTLNLESGKTFAGSRGQQLNELLAQLPAITANTSDITGNIDRQDQQLEQLTIEFDRITAQIASEDAALRGDLSNGSSILNTMAAHDQRLQDELVYANSSLGAVNSALNGHQQDLHAIFAEFPALLRELHTFNDNSATSLATIYPCINDVIQTIREMQDATKYTHAAGATDGVGNMLRVYPVLAGPSNGAFAPTNSAAYPDGQCTGSKP